MDFFANSAAILGVIALVLLYNSWRVKNTKTKRVTSLPPEVGGGLPLIGHIHQLTGTRHLCQILGDIADKYGSIFTIRLGVHPTVVISNYKILKEFYTTHDKIMSTRPENTFGKVLGYNYASFSIAPYGPFWRDLRKLTTVQLLSSHKLRSLNHVLLSEVNIFIKDLFLQYKENNNDPVKVNMSELLENMVLNTITGMMAGKRYCDRHNSGDVEKGRHIGEIMKDYMHLAAAFVPSDFVPFLGCLNFLGPMRKIKKVMEELDYILEKWVKEHEMKDKSDDNKQDFMDVLLSTCKDDPEFGNPRRTVIKATAMTVMLGGSDTTSVTMTWFVANLLNNRRILKLAQEEMDDKVGRERKVEESDIENLVYMNAIIKETLRMFPSGALAAPRESMEDCTFCGFQIPKGTRFLTNIWKLHRDPDIWENPDEFKPERFLTSHADLDFFDQHFEYVPFGSGRRSCPGSNFAMKMIPLAMARLIQGFNLTAPNNEPVDMTESTDVSFSRVTPLHVMLTPRLASQLYD